MSATEISSGQQKVKRCRICGDLAKGFNFSVVTCGSCRIFYHRNADKYEKLKCPKNRNCDIDFATRKCCSRCRMDKCFAIGMKRKNTVVVGTHFSTAKSIVEPPPSSALLMNTNNHHHKFVSSPLPSSKFIVEPNNQKPIAIIDSTVDSHSNNSNKENNQNGVMVTGPMVQFYLEPRESSPIVAHHHMMGMNQVVTAAPVEQLSSELSLKSLLQKEQNEPVETHPLLSVTTFKSQKRSHELNEYELYLIEQVQEALSDFNSEENVLDVLRQAKDLSNLIKQAGIYAKKIIKFCKAFSAFRSLRPDDQLAILRPFYIEILIIRIAYSFKESNENDISNQEFLNKLGIPDSKNMVKENVKFALNFHNEMENDSTIRNLLTAMALFSSREGIKCVQEYYRYHYFLYSQLLKRYLENKYKNLVKAGKKHRALLNLLQNDMKEVRENSYSLFSQIECDQANADVNGLCVI